MEQNCIKSNMFYNEKIYENSAEIPVDTDFTMPDFCPDISKVLKCKSIARISSKSINGDTLSIDGTLTINLLYSDEESKIFSYEYQYPFNKTFNIIGNSVNIENVCAICKCNYINYRAVSGRKVEIHGSLRLDCKIEKINSIDIVSDIEENNIEINRSFLPATTPMGNTEKYIILEEEIEVGTGQPPIRNILRYDCCSVVNEVKILNDKVVVKGEILIPILYCSDNDCSIQSIKAKIPFNQILDIQGINEECKCNAKSEIAYIDLKLRTTPTGEATSILANIKLLLSCEAVCNNEITVLSDAYSKKNILKIDKKEIEIKNIVQNICEKCNLKYDTELSDEIKNIIDIWCDIKEINTKTENNSICLYGDLVVGVIYLNNEDLPVFCERIFDFSIEKETASNTNLSDVQISVDSIGYFLKGESSLELRIDLNLCVTLYECKNLSFITDYKLDEKKENTFDCSMIIYYPRVGESIWEIAKQYNSSKEEIKKINYLNEDIISQNMMILIPIG